MATISSVPQLPPVPTQLPKTQASWDQLIAVFQTWSQILQGALPGSPLTVTNITATSYTVTQRDAGTVLRCLNNAQIMVPPMLNGSMFWITAPTTTVTIVPTNGLQLYLATGGSSAVGVRTLSGRGVATLLANDTSSIDVYGQGVT